LLAGCGSGGQSESGWTFVDDRRQKVSLEKRPTRIVAYATAAAALHDWGVTPVGVFGDDPREDILLAGLPWNKVAIVGSVWGQIDSGVLRALKADLIVSRWYPPPADAPVFGFNDLEQERAIGSQVPIVGINGHVIGRRQIDRFGDLAMPSSTTPSGASCRSGTRRRSRRSPNCRRCGRTRSGRGTRIRRRRTSSTRGTSTIWRRRSRAGTR